MRLNYYPVCPVPHLALGVGRHKDSGALTVLSQDDVGGLEVKRKLDGEWVLFRPTPNAYIINVGDVIQVCRSTLLFDTIIDHQLIGKLVKLGTISLHDEYGHDFDHINID